MVASRATARINFMVTSFGLDWLVRTGQIKQSNDEQKVQPVGSFKEPSFVCFVGFLFPISHSLRERVHSLTYSLTLLLDFRNLPPVKHPWVNLSVTEQLLSQQRPLSTGSKSAFWWHIEASFFCKVVTKRVFLCTVFGTFALSISKASATD